MPENSVAETTVVVTEALEGPGDRAVEPHDRGCRRAEPRLLVIDLAGSPRIDASAIVMLLQTHRSMVCADGRLLVRRPAPRVRRMLSLGRVDRLLDIEEQADRTGGARAPGHRIGPGWSVGRWHDG